MYLTTYCHLKTSHDNKLDFSIKTEQINYIYNKKIHLYTKTLKKQSKIQ